MNMRLLQNSIVFTSLLILSVSSAPVSIWFERANTYYEKQEYDSAVIYYQKIIDAGINNSDVYYNLGNSYYRLNKIGYAVLYFEKAKKLSPNDPDIIANLRFTRSSITDRIPEPQRLFIENIFWRLHTMFSLNVELWVLFSLLLLLSILFALSLFTSHNFRLWLLYISSLCIIITVFLGVSVGKKIYDNERNRFAIVLEKSVDAVNEPEGNKILFTVHEGTKFQIRKIDNEWSYVSLPNGVSGWVRNSTLGSI